VGYVRTQVKSWRMVVSFFPRIKSVYSDSDPEPHKMFERFNEKARRVILFGRYEASEYGSRYIETEHLLLGLLREDHALAKFFLGQGDILAEFRAEIEKLITLGARISISVEVPLSDECKRALMLAGEESERLGQRDVGTEHLLLGMLGVEKSLAAQLLLARGLKATEVRERLAKTFRTTVITKERQDDKARLTLESFLAGLKTNKADELIDFFAPNAQLIDVFGKRWNREEIFKEFETIFAPYAKKNAAPIIEEIVADRSTMFVANVLWKNVILASLQRIRVHRMSAVLIREDEDWRILLLHLTPAQPR
jgi:Clp amino terminal domain, pathogenicity island component/SnoaL-like domain